MKWKRTAAAGTAALGALGAVGVHDLHQKRHAILRSFPVIGHGRFLLERGSIWTGCGGWWSRRRCGPSRSSSARAPSPGSAGCCRP